MEINERELLVKTIIACDSRRRTLNINQVAEAVSRADQLLQKAEALLDREYINDGEWHSQFLMMLVIHSYQREIAFNEMEELSDQAARLHGLYKQVSAEN